jgi:topoisomerase IV subunit B
MTFFFHEMPRFAENGHLFFALPPLYRLTRGDVTCYPGTTRISRNYCAAFNREVRVANSGCRGAEPLNTADLAERLPDHPHR